MPKTYTPGKPGGITTRVKLQKKPSDVNTIALTAEAGLIGETTDPVNAIPFTQGAPSAGRRYQITLHARWPYPIQIDFRPDGMTGDQFAQQIRAALAEADDYLKQLIGMIARRRTLGVDRGAPARHGLGLAFGHSFGPYPILMDVRIDPYAVTPDILQGHVEALVAWLVSALARLRNEGGRDA